MLHADRQARQQSAASSADAPHVTEGEHPSYLMPKSPAGTKRRGIVKQNGCHSIVSFLLFPVVASSPSLSMPCRLSMMLDVLTSRWMMPCSIPVAKANVMHSRSTLPIYLVKLQHTTVATAVHGTAPWQGHAGAPNKAAQISPSNPPLSATTLLPLAPSAVSLGRHPRSTPWICTADLHMHSSATDSSG